MQWQCDSEIFIRVYKYSTFYLYLHECCGQLVNCVKVSSCIGNLCRHPTGKGTMPLTLHGLSKGSMISAVTQKLRESFFLMAFCSFAWLVLIFEIQIWTIICYVMLLQCCSLCVCVGHKREPCKNSWSNWNVVWWQTHVSCRNYIWSFRRKICECPLAPPGKYYSSIYAAAAMRLVPISVHTVLEAVLLPSCWHYRSHHMHHTDIVYCWM